MLLSFSEAERGRRGAAGFGVLEQTYLSLVRLLVSVKVYGLCRAESPQSTIMTRRITTTTTTKNVTLRWIHSAAFEELPKPLYKDIERSIRTVLELRKRAGPPDFQLTL